MEVTQVYSVLKKHKVETGQLELTVEHNGCCEGLEVAVLSPDYCRHELIWMHKEKRRGGWKQNNNVNIS